MTSAQTDSPIGIFDSGFGGLTVMDAIRKVLPCENLLYLGDTARVPYGNKTQQTIIRYSTACANLLVSRGVKALVIACNTASAYALETLQKTLRIPVLGVIEPVSRYAYKLSKSGHIAVIGTRATVASEAYVRALSALRPELEITQAACPLFVPLVEEGWCEHPITLEVCHEYLSHISGTRIDTIILGCTHYPLLRTSISRCLEQMHHTAQLCDCASATALELKETLGRGGLLRVSGVGNSEYLVTDAPQSFARIGQGFMQDGFERVEHVDL